MGEEDAEHLGGTSHEPDRRATGIRRRRTTTTLHRSAVATVATVANAVIRREVLSQCSRIAYVRAATRSPSSYSSQKIVRKR